VTRATIPSHRRLALIVDLLRSRGNGFSKLENAIIADRCEARGRLHGQIMSEIVGAVAF
jgi:hypothetical protein